MPPSLPNVVAEWARQPLDVLLAQPVQSQGLTLPEGAVSRALDVHKCAAAGVPAYTQFLAAEKQRAAGCGSSSGGSNTVPSAVADAAGDPMVDTPAAGSGEAAEITAPCASWGDVPFTSKQNYFHRFPLEQRCMGGSLPAADFVHASSGSSGVPTLWARNAFDELEVCTRFEQAFYDNFEAHRTTTLAVVAFPLGSWVGGLFTTLCLRYLTLKGYRVTTVTPGNQVKDILTLVQALAPSYQQTVLLGYPPFLKGVVDAGVAAGVPWSSYRMRLVLAGEVFSEEWRSLMAQRLGMRDILRDVVSLYGTADAAVIGCETGLSVAIRRFLAQRPEAAAQLFARQRLPTLVQYDPYSRLLETHPDDGTLVVSATGSANTAAPLLRYCIGDSGGIVSYADMLAFVQQLGFEMPPGLQSRKLPFAFVFGRSFWAVSVFGANVFVENIMSGMEQPELAEFTTGKFVLFVEESADLDCQLAVRVELVPGVQPSADLEQQVAAVLLRELRRLNSEYRSYVPEDRQLPKVHLHPQGEPRWFPLGVKHKWTLV